MEAAWTRALNDLKRSWRSSVALVLMIGIASAVVMGSAAGARRTDTVWTRFRAATHAHDAAVISCPGGIPWPEVDLDGVAALPEVDDAGRVFVTQGYMTDASGRIMYFGEPNSDTGVVGPVDAEEVDGFGMKVLDGRLPNWDAVDEVTLSYRRVQDPAAKVGETIYFHGVPADANLAEFSTDMGMDPSLFTDPIPLKVVGITLMSGPGREISGDAADVTGTPAFYRRYGSRLFGCEGEFVWLKDGLAGVDTFFGSVQKINPDAVFIAAADEATGVNRNVHINAQILWLFAAFVAAAGLVIFGQALARQTSMEAAENPILKALGMTRRQVFAVSMMRAAFLGVASAVLAVSLALAASGAFPNGAFAVAEPNPGTAFDGFILLGGACFVVLAVSGIAAAPAWKAARQRGDSLGTVIQERSDRTSVIADAAARGGGSPTVTTGIRQALTPGRGRTAVPVRSAVVGLVLSVSALSAAVVFQASFEHLFEDPTLVGVTFDTGAGNPFAHIENQEARDYFASSPLLDNLAGGNFAQSVLIEGPGGSASGNVWGMEQLKGEQHPPTIEGSWPDADGEIALGSKTMREAGASVGEEVTVSVGGEEVQMEVVGRVVFPDFGFGPGLGEGAGMMFSQLQQFFPQVDENLFLADIAPGTTLQEVQDEMGPVISKWGMSFQDANEGDGGGSSESLAVARRAKSVPSLLAGVLVLMSVAMLAHTLVTSIRRRRRDFAILKTLGFTTGQVSGTVAWQASTLVAVAALIGIPLGVILGRWGWNLFAENLGVFPVTVVPTLSVLLIVPVALLIANLLALLPGRAAGRTKPSVVLRSE